MSKLREAAQAALEHWDKVSGIFRMTTETNRLRAALAQPETKAEPVAWAVMCAGNAVSACLTETAANLIAENLREKNRGRDFDWQATPLYAHPPRDEWRPASEPPEESAAHAMGASGSPVVEGERLAFEAWMRGHCWELRATWTGDQYIVTDEGDVKSMATKGMLALDAMRTRMMWAAWRDRAALSRSRGQRGGE